MRIIFSVFIFFFLSAVLPFSLGSATVGGFSSELSSPSVHLRGSLHNWPPRAGVESFNTSW